MGTEPAERLAHVATELVDLVIIGGGITGSGIVRDAAMRGLNCILLEKDDFSSGTSSKSGKLIHGGLRYLRYMHFALVHESCSERYRLMRVIAPHIVRPIRMVMPFFRHSHTPRWIVTIGLYVYGLLALFRNVERFHFISKDELTKMEPHLRQADLLGGLSYSDCYGNDSRLTLDSLKSAFACGARLFNYCEVTKITFEKEKVLVQVTDRLSGADFTLQARAVVNAGGAWADDILSRTPVEERFKLTITCGIHLIFHRSRLPIAHPLGLEHPQDGRNLYMVPWGDYVLVGTTDNFFKYDKNKIPVQQEDIQYLLEMVQFHFPDLHLSAKDIQGVQAGVRPLIGSDEGKKEDEIPRDYKILTDGRGLVSVTGGKLTTYRTMAKKTVDELIVHFFQGRKLAKCKSLSPISGGDLDNLNREELDQTYTLSPNRIDLLVYRYGTNARKILEYTRHDPEKGEYIAPGLDYLWAEIDYMVDHEFAEKLGDIFFRRTQISYAAADHGMSAAMDVARYMGKLKGWSQEKIQREVDDYRREIEFVEQDLRRL